MVLLFAGYVAGCLLLLGAQLLLTVRECRRLSERGAVTIDQFYVRVERYLGLSFREKLADWLAAGDARPVAAEEQRVSKGDEQIVIQRAISLPAGTEVDDILVSERFVCGEGCRIGREVYVRGDCEIGRDSAVQALAADGRVRLRRAAHVVRWLDAAGPVALEADCRVQGRLTSSTAISLAPGTRVKSAYAPVVATAQNGAEPPARPSASAGPRIVLSDPAQPEWEAAGADRRRMRLLADDCVEYEGNLALPAVDLRLKLVVRGNLSVGAGSELRADVKATGSLRVACDSICSGNLVAGVDVHLGPMVMFAGVVYAERSVRLGQAVLGRAAGRDVAVYGCEIVLLDHDVWVQGKVAAGRYVVAAA